MAEVIAELDPARVKENLGAVREEIAAAARRAGRHPADVELVAAVKYVSVEAMGALAEAGVGVVGENRAQDLAAKADRWPGAFVWDFIGALQSRKVKEVLPYVRWIHSLASDSALRQLERHGTPKTEVLVEVNVAGEEGKAGIAPAELPAFLERCPVKVVGLMTMPPFAEDPERSRRHFAALREVAEARGLAHLSMGTTQDFAVAVEEGATVVRIGSRLYDGAQG
ncbi:MAG TPA: YggS family pyridoxal phosphate-dependent enzyme [Solirubrobacteraceae bacterium]